ncbi:MAG: hypothetical protein ISS57_03120 [Anaerolineales bacterium]|nr:hypothetical protein [Anaerolineales bacterium]
MPDVDRVNANLPRRYQKVYQQICEGYFSNAALAYDTLRPLRRDIQGYGNTPLQFLRETADLLNEIQALPLFTPTINWGEESKQISELKGTYSRKFKPKQRGMDYAVIACKEILRKLRNNEIKSPNVHHELVYKYIQRILDSNFVDRIPLSENHYLGIELGELCSRLNDIRPFVDDGIEFFASQIEKSGQARRLRLPPRANKKRTVDLLNDDVFKIE